MRHWIVAAAAAALLWPASAGAASPKSDQTASAVAKALKESGRLKSYAVGVKYEDGVAWLEGRVTSKKQAATAIELAKSVEGVNHVVNKLKITGAKKASPSQGADLRQALLQESQQTAKPASIDMPAPAPLPVAPQAAPVAQAAPAAPAPVAKNGMPLPFARTAMRQGQGGQVQPTQYGAGYAGGYPQGQSTAGARGVSYDQANMPGYAWPSYAAHPNYAAVTYPKQYSPAAWPYIGPFHPYPQVPLGWRKVTLEWDDGWWFLDFSHQETH